ncbi:hypothetical protein [Aeromicrobium sp. CF3.5]|uniref:hypothetical protein n=1 Tax=Aeromicrobium sp. CF3.5 TaxID=3373078 RepID=UPI003EE477E6
MSDNEIELFIEGGLPSGFPLSAKAGLKVRRTWERRGKEFTETICAKCSNELADLEERVADDDSFADLLVDGLDRAIRSPDDEYREVLASIVANAFADHAKIDQYQRLMKDVQDLDPFDLRVLVAAYSQDRHPAGKISPDELYLMDTHGLGIVHASLPRLRALGLIAIVEDLARLAPPKQTPAIETDQGWIGTTWGSWAYEQCRDAYES